MTKKIAIIIPARLASTRLPNKPLADIAGKSMIERVYNKAIEANIGEVFIACDGEEMANHIINFGGRFIITNPNLQSGTDRVHAALQQIDQKFDIIVNLQGDLPNIDPSIIQHAANAVMNYKCDIATIASLIKDSNEITNPNVVKIAVTFDENNCGNALYFSRAPIPYSKENSMEYFHHIGIYAYTNSALEKFVSLKPSNLEKRESLEQLRALENNMKIIVKLVETHPLSVDTQEDLEKIRNIILNQNEI